MKRTTRKSRCPVNSALEVVEEPWSLLVVRDIVFYGKHTFGEFPALESASRRVPGRPAGQAGQQRHPQAAQPGRQAPGTYSLTDAGLALSPSW